MGIKAALPRYELYLYTAVLGVALVWAGSWIFEASSGESCQEVSQKTNIIQKHLFRMCVWIGGYITIEINTYSLEKLT